MCNIEDTRSVVEFWNGVLVNFRVLRAGYLVECSALFDLLDYEVDMSFGILVILQVPANTFIL